MIYRHPLLDDVSRETKGRLEVYANLLRQWQGKVNLVSSLTMDDLWQRHFIDSMQLAPLISAKDLRIIDLGSGAGFPGMVLAIMGFTDIQLIESDRKKCLFLKEIARKTKTSVTIHNSRIENIKIEGVEVITSRACASLDQLLLLSQGFIKENTRCLFHKGKNHLKEIDEVLQNWETTISCYNSQTSSESAIVKLSNIIRKQ